MELNLKQIFEIPNEYIDLNYEFDLSDYELFGTTPFFSPIKVRGRVLNTAGVVEIKYSACFRLKANCDRCLDSFEREFSYDFSEIIVNEENPENDEYIGAPNCLLDVDELVLSDILLSLPQKMLCREDCKGLCPKCGTNLNRTTCQCNTKEVDPRLAVLGELLK